MNDVKHRAPRFGPNRVPSIKLSKKHLWFLIKVPVIDISSNFVYCFYFFWRIIIFYSHIYFLVALMFYSLLVFGRFVLINRFSCNIFLSSFDIFILKTLCQLIYQRFFVGWFINDCLIALETSFSKILF